MDTFSAIADPTRRRILDLLTARARNAGEIAAAFPRLTQPGVSRHLKVLREAHLVHVTVRAQERIYALNAEGMADLYAWMAKYQALWPEALDSLEHYLDAGAAKRKTKQKRA